MTLKATTSSKTAIVLLIILHCQIEYCQTEAYEHFVFSELRYLIFLITRESSRYISSAMN